MFKNNTIKNRVMAVINKKIELAQKDFDTDSEILVNDYNVTVHNLGQKLITDKDALLEKHVNTILGKIL